MPNQVYVISVLFFCKISQLARHAFALFERTASYLLRTRNFLQGIAKSAFIARTWSARMTTGSWTCWRNSSRWRLDRYFTSAANCEVLSPPLATSLTVSKTSALLFTVLLLASLLEIRQPETWTRVIGCICGIFVSLLLLLLFSCTWPQVDTLSTPGVLESLLYFIFIIIIIIICLLFCYLITVVTLQSSSWCAIHPWQPWIVKVVPLGWPSSLSAAWGSMDCKTC